MPRIDQGGEGGVGAIVPPAGRCLASGILRGDDDFQILVL